MFLSVLLFVSFLMTWFAQMQNAADSSDAAAHA